MTWMRGEVDSIYWMRLERLHHRLLKVEGRVVAIMNAPQTPSPKTTDIIATTSKVLGLLFSFGRILAWAMPYILIAAALVWSWMKPVLRWALGPS